MNSRVSIFIVFILIFFSCSTETREAPVVSFSEPKTLISETDTFYGGGNLLYIVDTTESVFTSFYKFKRDTSERNCIKKDAGFVSRKGDTLFLKLDNGSIKKIISTNDSETGSDFAVFNYITKLKDINYYVIFCSGMEWFSYLVVNSKTGKETYICGAPAVSPNKKYLAASCCDLQAGFVYNGIEMYNVESDSLKLNWKRELTKWGADELVWMNDHTLIVKKQRLDSTSSNVLSSFIKLSCIGK
jgi:hypothetical protein